MISSNELCCTRSLAGSLMMQWLAMARTEVAPAFFIASAAVVMVPAVSTMSSTSTTFLSFTSPMIVMLLTTLARALTLLQSTRSQLNFFAK